MLIPDPNTPRGVLGPAKALTVLRGVRQMNGRRRVDLVHILLDAHHVLFAEGAPSESFFPGPMAMRSMNAAERQAVRSVRMRRVPTANDPSWRQARSFLSVQEGRARLRALGRCWTKETLVAAGVSAREAASLHAVV